MSELSEGASRRLQKKSEAVGAAPKPKPAPSLDGVAPQAPALQQSGSVAASVAQRRSAGMPPEARNRPLAEALADDRIPLDARRRLMDCEFSFGTFGQGGGIGGVVETSSLPWRVGTALATLLSSLSPSSELATAWQTVREADTVAFCAAVQAIADDHAKACEALRVAESSGQASLAEVLKARGATTTAVTASTMT